MVVFHAQGQVDLRASGAFAGIGGIVEQHHQQVADAGLQHQAHWRVLVAAQLDGGPHQAPLFQHFFHGHLAAQMAVVGRCCQCQHALVALHQQLAQGVQVLAQFALLALIGDVVHQQGHGGQRRVQFVRHRGRMRGQRDDAFVARKALAQGRDFALALAHRKSQPCRERQHHHGGQQEVGRHAPHVQAERVEAAVGQRQTERCADHIAGHARCRYRHRPAQRQRQRGQRNQHQE